MGYGTFKLGPPHYWQKSIQKYYSTYFIVALHLSLLTPDVMFNFNSQNLTPPHLIHQLAPERSVHHSLPSDCQ